MGEFCLLAPSGLQSEFHATSERQICTSEDKQNTLSISHPKQVVLSDGAKGDFFTINWGWGVSVTLAVLISGGVSGGHVNPAVTVAMSAIGKLPLIKVVPYMISQVRHLVQGGPTGFNTGN